MNSRLTARERAVCLAEYIVENNATVRKAADVFGVSKSTVHKYITERLQRLDPTLHAQVRTVLERNKAQRHLRGGAATKEKYRSLRSTDSISVNENPAV